MPASVTVLAGPAGCGKTERLLAGYRAALAERPIGASLWISPTHRSAAEVRALLLSGELRACLRPAVMTFAQFAEQLLAASDQLVRPISELVKRHLIRRLIDQTATAGKLRHFGPIAGTTGLVDLVAEFISELKRFEIWPEDFEWACRMRGQQAKDLELTAIYSAYQDHLTRQNLYDAEGRFWSARELLRKGMAGPFDALQHVVIDGFTDFTQTQHEILQHLAARAQELYVTLPLEAGNERPDLFAKSQQTLKRLRDNLGSLRVRAIDRPERPGWPALAHIETELFKSPRRARRLATAERIEIIEAARSIDEMRLIARRIKELLVAGDPDDGRPVRAGDVAVVLRSLNGTRLAMAEVFDEVGIPVAFDAQPTISQAPVIAAVLSLLQLHVLDWPFRQLLALVGSNYFQPSWREWHSSAAAPAIERTIRRMQIVRGRSALLAALRRADAETPSANEDTLSTGEDVRTTLAFVDRLSAAFARLPSWATVAEWAAALAALTAETGLVRAIDTADERVAGVDRSAWDQLMESLSAAERFTESAPGEGRKLDASQFFELVADVARTESLPAPADESGRVRVLSAASARALSIVYLFFAGLSERAFPPAERADRLYSESEYERFAAVGLPLVLRAEHSQEEMLLFYEVLTRARRRLYLSYPGLDDKGQPLLPSPYLAELEDICGSDVKHFHVDDLRPIPRDNRAASATEQRVLGMAQAMGMRSAAAASSTSPSPAGAKRSAKKIGSPGAVTAGETSLLAGLGCSEQTRPALENILAGLRATGSREQRDAFGQYEGMMTSNEIRRRLQERFGPEVRWSASRLEQFRACPFQFFLNSVLHLEAPTDLSLATDYLARGSTLHAALARLHRELNDAHSRAISAADPAAADTFRTGMARLLADMAAADDRRQPLPAAMAEIDRRVMVTWLEAYLAQHARYDEQWRDFDVPLAPAHFEVSFGEEQPGGDELSSKNPLVIADGQRQILVRGRIDRLDVGRVDGAPVFSVLDYKSGRADRHSRSAVEAGDDLQVFLYTLAAAQLFEGRGHRPWVSGYWFLADGGFSSKRAVRAHERGEDGLRSTEEWAALYAANVDRILALVEAIRGGEFPVASRNEHCTSYCDFRTVCRVNQVRALEKSWEPAPQPT